MDKGGGAESSGTDARGSRPPACDEEQSKDGGEKADLPAKGPGKTDRAPTGKKK